MHVSLVRSPLACRFLFALSGTALANSGGSKSFIARRKSVPRAVAPAQITWARALPRRRTCCATLTIDATSVLRDVKALSAAAARQVETCGADARQ